MTRLQRVITSARGKKLSVKRANIEAWKGTRTVSFYTDNKERARLRNATKRPRGVSSITRKSSVDFSSRKRKIGAFLFSIYFFEISYRILLDGWTHFFDHVPRPITREGVDARGSLHVSRICIESRHNEADYRKIVHEYLESGGEGGMVGFHTERVSKYRRDADRFRDDERKREAMNGTMPSVFNDLRIWKTTSSKFADNKKRIERWNRHGSVVVSDRFMTRYSNRATEQFRVIFFIISKIAAPLVNLDRIDGNRPRYEFFIPLVPFLLLRHVALCSRLERSPDAY